MRQLEEKMELDVAERALHGHLARITQARNCMGGAATTIRNPSVEHDAQPLQHRRWVHMVMEFLQGHPAFIGG